MDDLPRNIESLAAKLAEIRGTSPDEAIVVALEETLARSSAATLKEPRLEGDDLIRRLEEISARARSLPILDHRSPDEILGYDEFGLPT